MRRLFWVLVALLLSGAGSANAASTINSLPQITPFPLTDPGCPATSTENLWISRGNAVGNDFRITPTQLGYIYQGTTAPACPYRYQFWWDTSLSPAQKKVYDGAIWLTVGALNFTTHVWSLPNPVLSGTVTGTYTLGGTILITSPTITNPVFTGTFTGIYTIAGTVNITSPTIANPTITGTLGGANVVPLAGLAQIAAYKVLGNSTGLTANVTAAYGVSGTGTTLASTTGTFLAGDVLIAADLNGTVQSASSTSPIYYRRSNPGGSNILEILNNNTGAGTASELSLNTGSVNAIGEIRLNDDPVAANRKLQIFTGAGVGGGISIDASGGGAASVLALKGGSNADGITLSGTPEVLYSYLNASAYTAFRVFNNSNAASSGAYFRAQTGTGGATVDMLMVDTATPTGSVGTGAGATGGLKLATATGPIQLLPVSVTVPQVAINSINAGTTTQFQVNNGSSAAGTTSAIVAATGTAGAYINMSVVDGATPITTLLSGVGATNGLEIKSLAGSIRITPFAVVVPQTIVGPTIPGGNTQLEVLNNSTAGGTIASFTITTGTANSWLYQGVNETGHTAVISTAAGLTGGLEITSALGGAASILLLTSGGAMTVTSGGTMTINSTVSMTLATTGGLTITGLATVAAGTGKRFLCIDGVTKIVYEGTGASCV